MVVKLHRCSELFNPPTVQYHDPVGHRHRLDLIVGDVDHRRIEVAVQLAQLDPHVTSERGIEIRQRLVEEKHFGFTHDRPPNRNALTLTARQLPGLQL